MRPHNSPLPPHLGSYARARLVSQDRRHLFVTPCLSPCTSLLEGSPPFLSSLDFIGSAGICVGPYMNRSHKKCLRPGPSPVYYLSFPPPRTYCTVLYQIRRPLGLVFVIPFVGWKNCFCSIFSWTLICPSLTQSPGLMVFPATYPPPPHTFDSGTSLEPRPWRGQLD